MYSNNLNNAIISTVLPALMLVFVAVSEAANHHNVVLRLLDMYRDKRFNNNSGTVAIRYQNQWGTICNSSWDIHDATVACRQMGYRGAIKVGYFGEGNKKIILGGVNCTGTEATLGECKHSPWGSSPCQDGHSAAAGVVCTPEKKIDDLFDVRLYRGHEGIVEVRRGGIWGTVCSDNWKIQAANVVCKHLGYSGATQAYPVTDHTKRPVLIGNVQCNGKEKLLQECLRTNSWATSKSNCSNRSIAAVQCKLESKNQQHFALRLSGGTATYGTVEVFRYGRWGTICDDGWDKQDADVVCRQLGYAYAMAATHESRFGQGTGRIFLSNVRCRGHEMSLAECHRTYNWGDANFCQNYEAAGVVCAQLKVQTIDACAAMTKTLGKRVFFESPGYPDTFSYDGGTSCWCKARGMKKTHISVYVNHRQFQYNYRERLEFFWGRSHKGNITKRRRVHGDSPPFAMGPFSFEAESFLLGFYDFGVAGEGKFRIEYRANRPVNITCHRKSSKQPSTTMQPVKIPRPFHSDEDDHFIPGKSGEGVEKTKMISVSHQELSKLIVSSFFGGGLGMGMIILSIILAYYLGKKKLCKKRKGHLKENAYSMDVEGCSDADTRESITEGAVDDPLTENDSGKLKIPGVVFTNGRKRKRRVTFLLRAMTPPCTRKHHAYINEAYENYLDSLELSPYPQSKSDEECENNNNENSSSAFPESDL